MANHYIPYSSSFGCRLQGLANQIVEYFVQKNVMPRKQYESVKLHVTLMNTRYRSGDEDDVADEEPSENGGGKTGYHGRNGDGRNFDNYSKRESFDARQILEVKDLLTITAESVGCWVMHLIEYGGGL